MDPDSDQLFLVLFGTGMRFRSSLSNVSVKIGGIDAPVEYAGPQGEFAGLDQINVRLPRCWQGEAGPCWISWWMERPLTKHSYALTDVR